MKNIPIIICLMLFLGNLMGQNSTIINEISGLGDNQALQNIKEHKPKWAINNPGQTHVFIKNFGQYDHLLKTPADQLKQHNQKVQYVLNGNNKVFFTSTGSIWKLDKFIRKKSKEVETESEENEQELSSSTETCFICMNWEGVNPNVQLIAEDEADGYYTYLEEGYHDLKAKGYKKLIYKDLYPGIDVEYIIPQAKGGIKYSLIIKPGADVSNIKMRYTGDFKKMRLNPEGNIVIKTEAGDLIDHAPESFSSGDETKVKSDFKISDKNCVEFNLPEGYNNTKTLTIDPWTIVPNLSGGNGAYDVGYDKYGNIYIGFVSANAPQISKYSATGTFLWTLNLSNIAIAPYPTYSRFCVIPSGSIFIASGFTGANNPGILDKVSSAGALLNTVTWPAALNNEGWMVNYNACLNTLLVGGGGISGNICLRKGVDTSLAGVFAGTNFNGFTAGWPDNDIACMRIDANGDLYSYFTTSKLPAFNNTIVKSLSPYTTKVYSQQRVSCPFNEVSGIPTGLGPGTSTNTNRLNMLEINSNYLFFFDGQNLEARSKATGVLITSILVSGTYTCGGNGYAPIYQNEGIAVDDCNNVYLGGQGLVHAFNFNGTSFTTLASTAVPDNVYDIALDKTRQLLYIVGYNFVKVIPALSCLNSNPLVITPTSNGLCSGNGTATISVTGGTPAYTYSWSNGATTNTINAPLGTYTVTVTDGSCNNRQVGTTVVTITNPSGPTINNLISYPPSCNSGNNGSATILASGGSGNLTYSWSGTGGTGQTATNLSAGNYTVTVKDAAGCQITTTIAIAAPPPLIGQFRKGAGGCSACGCNEWILINASGGTAPYTYAWPGGYNRRYQNHLCPGVYSINIKDKNGCNVVVNLTAP